MSTALVCSVCRVVMTDDDLTELLAELGRAGDEAIESVLADTESPLETLGSEAESWPELASPAAQDAPPSKPAGPRRWRRAVDLLRPHWKGTTPTPTAIAAYLSTRDAIAAYEREHGLGSFEKAMSN